jgi:hypothetical protein
MLKNTQHPKHVVALLLVASAVCLIFLAVRAVPVRADAAVTPPAAPLVVETVAPTAPTGVTAVQPAAPTAPPDPLIEYTLSIMRGWTPALPNMPTVPYEDVAASIVSAASTPQDAALLAALAYWEGARYAAYVDDGRCHDPAWRATPEGITLMHQGGDCDSNKAWTLWQIRPVEDRRAALYTICSLGAITASRDAAARCALEIAHSSLKAVGSLANYTGEWWGPHPAADKRWNFAQAALAKRPFKPSLAREAGAP